MSSDDEVLATASETGSLAHIDGAGRARMVDVTGKAWTRRRALARCRVVLVVDVPAESGSPSLSGVFSGSWKPMLDAARISGIQAAKQTANLIPLCHPLTVTNVDVRLSGTARGIEIEGEAETFGPTGVEMEALTACAFAALTIASALEESERRYSIEDLALWHKSGGRSGNWART